MIGLIQIIDISSYIVASWVRVHMRLKIYPLSQCQVCNSVLWSMSPCLTLDCRTYSSQGPELLCFWPTSPLLPQPAAPLILHFILHFYKFNCFRSHGICLSVPGLLHLVWHPPGLSCCHLWQEGPLLQCWIVFHCTCSTFSSFLHPPKGI